jgi:hypothetical protein
MYDYATSVYEKRKYAALTQNIEIHHYSISPNSRDNTSLFKELLIEKDKRTNHYSTCFFSHYFFLTQIEPFLPTSFLMPIIKRQGKRERW